MVTSLSWRSAIVGLSQSLTPASSSRGRPIWFQGSHGQPCAWNREHSRGTPCLLCSGVCAGLMSGVCTDASEKGLAFAVREGCRELALEVGRVSERARFKRSSRSIRAKSRALRYIAPDVGLDCSSSDENEASLAGGESSGLPEVSLHILDPSKWTLTACGGFFREENIIVLGARSILYVV